MAGKDHKALAMIFGLKPKPGEEHDDAPDEGDGYDDGGGGPTPEFEDCCKEAMQALEAKDERGFCEALWSAFQVFESHPHDEAGEAER